jgi:NAD(P)-dependent dehydrogenase (short-subunit alcohol dehydrogenase family)
MAAFSIADLPDLSSKTVIAAVPATEVPATVGGAPLSGAPEVRELDLARLDSIHAFAAAWQGEMDLLINNAGVMVPPLSRTADIAGDSFAGPGFPGLRGAPKLAARSAAARDEAASRRLWSASEELTGISFPEIHRR